MSVAGFGFTVPLLRPYLNEARRVISLMPAQQGVMPWPAGAANVSVLCEETLWPIEADSIDRLVVMHGLESGEDPVSLLDECYRVLAPEGRGVFIVPNRAGLWARRDATPFGFGRPYTLGQLEAMLAGDGIDAVRQAKLFGSLMSLPVEARYGPLKLSPQQLRERTYDAYEEQLAVLSSSQPKRIAHASTDARAVTAKRWAWSRLR